MNQYIDATILRPEATKLEYESLCCDAIKYELAAVCIPPTLVLFCKSQLEFYPVKIASVVGFPNGYQLLNTKLNEIEDLIEAGADEIDFVINRSHLADKNYEEIYLEARHIIEHCRDKNVVSKWIIESSIQKNEEIKILCDIANELRPDFVKTSTGIYGKANLENVVFLRAHLNPEIQIKASGGITSNIQAEEYINAGATRLGTSNYSAILSV